ncbi:hypothetical protein LshimejAT787_2300780 [Lyophyllum shimeji]|uniref:Uncharacterized protein n=1 Tax=Lyophyllum shimeji TaxID=47721 RepID=A0A9P3UUD7_LYOSH|nr:hypothetical protein LshimejAT787_2300780 [Lyophyllum shimeji]
MSCPLRQGNNVPHRIEWDCVQQGHATYCWLHATYTPAGMGCPSCQARAERRARGALAIEALRQAQAKRV